MNDSDEYRRTRKEIDDHLAQINRLTERSTDTPPSAEAGFDEEEAALREGRKYLQLLAEEKAQYEEFQREHGMRAYLTERIALAKLRMHPHCPVGPKGIADLWNSNLLWLETDSFKLAHRRLAVLAVTGVVFQSIIGTALALVLTFFYFSPHTAGHLAALLASAAVIVGFATFVFFDTLMPVIRARRLARAGLARWHRTSNKHQL